MFEALKFCSYPWQFLLYPWHAVSTGNRLTANFMARHVLRSLIMTVWGRGGGCSFKIALSFYLKQSQVVLIPQFRTTHITCTRANKTSPSSISPLSQLRTTHITCTRANRTSPSSISPLSQFRTTHITCTRANKTSPSSISPLFDIFC